MSGYVAWVLWEETLVYYVWNLPLKMFLHHVSQASLEHTEQTEGNQLRWKPILHNMTLSGCLPRSPWRKLIASVA